MRLALAMVLGLGLVLGQAAAQEHTRILELSKQLALGTESLKVDQTAIPAKPKKLGERILTNLLTDGASERARQDPIFERFDEAADELAELALDLDRPEADIADERAFIRQFRDVERLAIDVDRTATRSSARKIMSSDVKPALAGIRRELRTLSAYRDDERREFYRRDRERL